VKIFSGVDGVLAGHGVGDEENLAGVEELFEMLHFGHEVGVDVEAAGGVDDEGVAAMMTASRRASLARRSTNAEPRARPSGRLRKADFRLALATT